MTFADFAPAANIFISQFDEVDRPFMFIFPFDGKHLPLAPVDLDDGAGPDQRPHGETGEELRRSCEPRSSKAFPSSFRSSMTIRK